MIKNLLYRAVFIIGWLLSPFTFWNDVFINIPLSYLLASLFSWFFPTRFLLLVLVFYWLSNGVGVYLMYIGGRQIITWGRGHLLRETLKLLIAIMAYSIILIVLDRCGILKPLPRVIR